MTLVTFIIPTIGRTSLQTAIDSLYKQTIWDWKAIIIFDGIEPNIKITDPRIKIMICEKLGTGEIAHGYERNNGAGLVRNFGIKVCDTEWVAFLDDDDTISHTYLETFYNELENVYKPDVILFRMRHSEYGVLPKTNSVDIIQYESGISFALKTKIFNDGIWFSPSHAEDFDLLSKIKNAGYKIVMSPYVKYFVGNYNHTDFDPEKGRRILINHHKII